MITDWFTAVGTCGASAIAAWVVVRDSKDRKAAADQKMTAQAARVRVSIPSWREHTPPREPPGELMFTTATITVANTSDQVITDVVVSLEVKDPAGYVRRRPEPEAIGRIDPERDRQASFEVVINRMIKIADQPTFGSSATFTDSAGHRWGRDEGHHLVEFSTPNGPSWVKRCASSLARTWRWLLRQRRAEA